MRDYTAPVLETLRQTGLDPSTYLIFGGAAMAMHGIRPAHGVDLLVEGTVFRKMASDLLTPGGLTLVPRAAKVEEGQERLESAVWPDKDSLSLDIWGLTGNRSTPIFDSWMRRTADMTTDQGTLHVMELEDILTSKKKSLRIKDRIDARRIQAFQNNFKLLQLTYRSEGEI